MSAVAERVIAAFDSLPSAEKQAVAREILRRLPRFDSGPLDDNDVPLAGDEMAAMLERERKWPFYAVRFGFSTAGYYGPIHSCTLKQRYSSGLAGPRQQPRPEAFKTTGGETIIRAVDI